MIDDMLVQQYLETYSLLLQRIAFALERSCDLDEAYLAWEQKIRAEDLAAEAKETC